MNEKENRLEEISNKINNYEATKHPPVFEMYVTLFSILMAVMLFLFPDMLQPSRDGITNVYWLLLIIMPQYMWALLFFIVGITKSVGLLLDNNVVRVTGLTISVIMYAVFSAMYIINFPTIGTVVFVSMTIFTLFSISAVKHTGIKS